MERISLFSPLEGDYTSRSAELARQQKLAQMLTEMSQQEMPVSTAGGITAPVSPYGALAKALTSFGGSYLSGKSAADEAALKKSDQEMAQKALENFYALPDSQQLALSKQPAAPTSFDINVPSLPGQVGPQDVAASVALPGVSRPELVTVAGRATTPQEQMQKLAPLMQGGETSRSVYNAFMPGVIKQQQADAELDRQIKRYTPLINNLSEDQQTKVKALMAADPEAGLDLVSKIFETNLGAPKTQRIASQLGGYDEIITYPNGATSRQHFGPDGVPTGDPMVDGAKTVPTTNSSGSATIIKQKTINGVTYYQTSDGKWHN